MSVNPSSEPLVVGHSPLQEASTRNLRSRIAVRWPIHITNPADKIELSCFDSHRPNTTVFLETYPFILNQ